MPDLPPITPPWIDPNRMTAGEQVEHLAAAIRQGLGSRPAPPARYADERDIDFEAHRWHKCSLDPYLEPASYPLPVFGPDASAEDIAHAVPAEYVQDVATLLNARAWEQEAVVKALKASGSATDYLLTELGSLVSLTPADKQRLRDAIDAHETENRA